MKIPILSEEQYQAIKERLHHAHDKFWKMLFMLLPVMREYLIKVIMPQLPGVSFDLDNLVLDNTSYLNPKLQPFYSDLVYLTTMTDRNGNPKPVKIALLLEHKSEMPSPLEMRIQLLEYMVAIQRRNYDSKKDQTLVVIPNVFNQFDKGWQMKPFRSLFGDLNPAIAELIPEFKVLMTDLPDFSPKMMDAFEKYGELRAGLLAMQHVYNKKYLIKHFEEIFVFLEQHPERVNMRNQMIAYLLSTSGLTAQEFEDLLKNIFSPILKKDVMTEGVGFIAVAAREAAEKTEQRVRKEEQKAQLATLQLKTRTLMMRIWKKGVSIDIITDVVELKKEEVEALIAAFERGKTYFEAQKRVQVKKMMEITSLIEAEAEVLIKILKEKKV